MFQKCTSLLYGWAGGSAKIDHSEPERMQTGSSLYLNDGWRMLIAVWRCYVYSSIWMAFLPCSTPASVASKTESGSACLRQLGSDVELAALKALFYTTLVTVLPFLYYIKESEKTAGGLKMCIILHFMQSDKIKVLTAPWRKKCNP